ncbi:MAG: hypothetical protein KatS3mg060_1185 [Dehalococcoidia bacterium]|nr:MAG: hypothetical protein KatS3mg060_1185 [Dehalococcoidia bacterium]
MMRTRLTPAQQLASALAYYQREHDELLLLRRAGASYRQLAVQRAAVNDAWAEVERLRALVAHERAPV